VLVVCTANRCRSPMAEGTFRHLVEEQGLEHLVEIDSAGTGAWHVGNPPDHRALATAARRGISMAGQRARKVRGDDFERFDYVLAMDRDNLADLLAMAPSRQHDRIRLFLDFAPRLGESEVPDPYYGGESGFDHVFDLVEAASDGLLEAIRRTHFSD